MSCVVLYCRSHSSRRDLESKEHIGFHKFPADKEMRQKWIDAISRKNWSCKKHSHICSKHFEEKYYINNHSKWNRLHPDAVPSLYLGKDRNFGVEAKSTLIELDNDHTTNASNLLPKHTSKVLPSQCTPELLSYIGQLKRDLDKARGVSKLRLLKINAMRQRERRLKQQNKDLNSRLVELLQKEKIRKIKLNAVKLKTIKLLKKLLPKRKEMER